MIITKADMAMVYAKGGWQVFPVYQIEDGRCTCRLKENCERPGKHPMTANGLKDASSDEMQVKKWWATFPNANIGVATGAASDIVVLDIDAKKDGFASLSTLIAKHPRDADAFLHTVSFRTGGGGMHYVFKRPARAVKNSVEKLGKGVDVRGDGGYIVVPPSNHVSGNSYEIERLFGTTIMPMPSWLDEDNTTDEKQRNDWKQIALPKIAEGGRNETITKLVGHLFFCRVDPAVVSQLVHAFNAQCNVPPLSKDEVDRTIRSIAIAEKKRRQLYGVR